MKESTGTKLKEADKSELNSELVKRKKLKDTPFEVISVEKDGKYEHFGVLGEYRVTEVYDKASKVESEVIKITWNRIIQVSMILIEKMKVNDITIKK